MVGSVTIVDPKTRYLDIQKILRKHGFKTGIFSFMSDQAIDILRETPQIEMKGLLRKVPKTIIRCERAGVLFLYRDEDKEKLCSSNWNLYTNDRNEVLGELGEATTELKTTFNADIRVIIVPIYPYPIGAQKEM